MTLVYIPRTADCIKDQLQPQQISKGIIYTYFKGYRVLRLAWIQSPADGKWRPGEWNEHPYDRREWTKFRRTGELPRHVQHTLNREIAAGAGANLPPEVLNGIVECAAGVPVPSPELIEKSYPQVTLGQFLAFNQTIVEVCVSWSQKRHSEC